MFEDFMDKIIKDNGFTHGQRIKTIMLHAGLCKNSSLIPFELSDRVVKLTAIPEICSLTQYHTINVVIGNKIKNHKNQRIYTVLQGSYKESKFMFEMVDQHGQFITENNANIGYTLCTLHPSQICKSGQTVGLFHPNGPTFGRIIQCIQIPTAEHRIIQFMKVQVTESVAFGYWGGKTVDFKTIDGITQDRFRFRVAMLDPHFHSQLYQLTQLPKTP